MADKTMTVRLSEAQADALEAVAQVKGLAAVEVIRQALTEYIDRCRRDPAFQRRLRASVERQRKVMEDLRSPGSGPAAGDGMRRERVS
jgi:hypothetical protein